MCVHFALMLKDRLGKLILKLTKIECCFFHLSQAHLRTCRMQELGLRILYIERKNIAAVARNLTALGFCTVSDVVSAFKELKKNLHMVTEYTERPNVCWTKAYSSRMVNIKIFFHLHEYKYVSNFVSELSLKVSVDCLQFCR